MSVTSYISATLQHRRYKYTLVAVLVSLLALTYLVSLLVCGVESAKCPFANSSIQYRVNADRGLDLDKEYTSKLHTLHHDILPGSDDSSASQPTYITSTGASEHPRSYLHLLIPATSSNPNLCKLLLSMTALGYPAPTFINWGNEEKLDPYINHVEKVHGILRYLKKFPTERYYDLALVVDGYDLYFQLRPDVVISRYYDIVGSQNAKLAQRFGGQHVVNEKGLKNTIVFGPDKICWPEDPRRPACWAVPESPLPRYAFGPDTDSGRFREHNRPRWLNSGTIIGPIGDLILLYEATLERTKNSREDVISDQFHLSDLFGKQEVARKLLLEWTPENLLKHPRIESAEIFIPDDMHGKGHLENISYNIPDLSPEENHEFHITVDHESLLFQTNAYYWKYLDWTSYDGSTYDGSLTHHDEDGHNDTARAVNGNSFDRQHHFELPDDILRSPPPFQGIGAREDVPVMLGKDPSRDPRPAGMQLPSELSWKDVLLGTNIVSRHVFALFHCTPPKEWLELWWHDMWYFPYGEAIIKHAPQFESYHIITTSEGREWWSWLPKSNAETLPEKGGSGGFDDRNDWHDWHSLCHYHENVVFFNARKKLDTTT